MSSGKNTLTPFYAGMTLLFVLGTILRLWHWQEQILLDDEWHALNFVLDRNFAEVLLEQGVGANSIPVNVYTWLVLHSIGWSEPLLYLPSILTGLAALIVIPLLAARVWGRSVGLIVAAMLATAPTIIFYSRITRPYAPTMLLATSSLLLTLHWLKHGRRRDLLFSAGCGSLAIYYHLYAAIPVCLPLATAFLLATVGKRWVFTLPAKTPLTDFVLAGTIMAVVDGILVVVPNMINPWWSRGIHGMDRATLDTAKTFLELVAGTPVTLLKVAFLLLAVWGVIAVFLESRPAGIALTTPCAVFFIAMYVTTQDGSHAGIQIARYGITFFPVIFCFVAVGLVKGAGMIVRQLSDARRIPLITVGIIAVWTPFLATSPLWGIYQYPNNFANHSAYQYRYTPKSWERSPERDLVQGFSIGKENIPPFYLDPIIIKAAPGIIEYPMLVGDHFNIFFYYQHFHRRPVVAGYLSKGVFPRIPPDGAYVVAGSAIDYVMSSVPASYKKNFSWRAMADLGDVDLLKKKHPGWFLVVHLNPLHEIVKDNKAYYPLVPDAVQLADDNFGAPVYRDDKISVWVVR